uniref:Inhibitor of apoptosis-promoting Bax1 n=1 Tax=viral metagenome TaxID=1070528 RepID=A0A6C0B8D1_9ZZZZ
MKNINLFSSKQTFLILVFANLVIQTIITRYSMLQSPKQKNRWYSFAAFLVMLALIVIMSLPIQMWIKFLVFCLFSVIEGYTLASMFTNDTIVQFAFYGTLSIFCSMIGISSVITMLGIKLGPRVGLGLFLALLLFLLFLIFNILSGQIANKLLAMVGILLFSMYVVYDTNKILQRDYKGDFISASLDYYLDFLNLFVDISWLNK